MSKNIIVTEEQLTKIVNQIKNVNEDQLSESSDGNYMAKQQLFSIATLAYKMWEMLEEGEELEDWMETKIAQCDQSITSVVKAFMYDEMVDGDNSTDLTVNYDDLVIGT